MQNIIKLANNKKLSIGRIFILIFSCCLYANSIHAQQTHSLITILGGGSASFNFNSFDKFNNGITYSEWTRLNIYFVDTTGINPTPGAHWRLRVRSLNADIEGTSSSMDLNKIQIQVTNAPAGSTFDNTAWHPLGLAYTDLINDGPNMTTTGVVTITYRVGGSGTNQLYDEASDYYVVDLDFLLEKQP